MNLQDLIYFKSLAENKSFTKTAEKHFVSQPSISLSLKRLENEFGTALIIRNRSTRSVELTEAGSILYNRALTILQTIEQTREEILQLDSESVQFGFLPTIGGHFLPKMIPSLSEYVGHLKLVEEESSDEMLRLVSERKIPCAIVGSDRPTFNEDWMIHVPIAQKPLAIWVSPNHPLAQYKELETKDLKDTSFVCLTEGYTHKRIFDKWKRTNGLNLPVHYTSEIQTANSMIASGMSASLMIDLLVRDRPDIVQIPLKDAPIFHISLIINKKADVSPIQKQFHHDLIQAIETEFNES